MWKSSMKKLVMFKGDDNKGELHKENLITTEQATAEYVIGIADHMFGIYAFLYRAHDNIFDNGCVHVFNGHFLKDQSGVLFVVVVVEI